MLLPSRPETRYDLGADVRGQPAGLRCGTKSLGPARFILNAERSDLPRILYVTSFDRAMYRVTGKRLLDSFLKLKVDGRLLVCHEGFRGQFPFRCRQVSDYDLDHCELLHGWIARNRDIIPERFGGYAPSCHCDRPDDPFARHRPACPASWFNRNASRWFRKVVSLHAASRQPGYDALVWVDADSVFSASPPADEVIRWFRRCSVFYLKSPDRGVIESGVLGVRNCPAGRKFVDFTMERYQSSRFRRNARWDDGYQIQLALHQHPEISSVDLAEKAGPNGDVVPYSPIAPYLTHEKGTHAYRLKLVG